MKRVDQEKKWPDGVRIKTECAGDGETNYTSKSRLVSSTIADSCHALRERRLRFQPLVSFVLYEIMLCCGVRIVFIRKVGT